MIEHLNGEHSEAETHERVLVRTRKFARHQETWFRNLSECRWVELDTDWSAESVVETICELGS